jgi:hypothetical protein
MQVYIHSQGLRYGPFTPAQINESIRRGEISPASTMAWYEGCDGWVPLGRVPGVEATEPAMFSASLSPANQGDATGGLIPYKNPYALFSYYLGIFGLIPCAGVILAIFAVVLGILGLKERKKNPIVRGTAHAWVGIILGGLSILVHLLVFLLLSLAALSSP